MHVAELMTTSPVTTRGDAEPVSVGPETDLATAADLLASVSVPVLVVVDADGQQIGVVSRSDVARTLASREEPGRTELDPLARRLLELTCRAPSVHNTQPWLWRVDGPTIELYADGSRRLTASDPDGRTMVISCGAALHHLRVAARGLGRPCTVERLPEGPRSTLLARVTLGPAVRVDDQVDDRHQRDLEESARDLEAIAARGTDRRRFTSWPVPEQRLDLLASIGSREGCLVVPVVDPQQRHRLEELVERARAWQASDPGLRDEQLGWTGRGSEDGVPEPALEGPATRFDDRPVIDPAGIERADGVLVLATATDQVLDHLRTGEALSRIWLTATSGLLSLVPLSQVVEAPEIRRTLQQDVLGTALSPQLLVRVGWQETSRDRLPPSPRRPLADMLLR